jgi:2-polyprenyl-3-methyl-5-hydroxy-6-metoxy-1,4-benzoquinol methylase
MDRADPMPNGTMYPETADIETSSDDYATRFSGPGGAWMLGVQEQTVVEWMADYPAATVLDVGGGHGQLAVPLARRGYRVTVLGSDPACARRISREVGDGRIAFATGNLLDLPYGDGAFAVVVCIRLLPHCTRWQQLVGELCRVARRAVIADYPTVQSLNRFSSPLFGMKKRVERNTRPFALFRHEEIIDQFSRHGYRPGRRRPQFFLPMVVHRMLNRPRLSARLERWSSVVGVTPRIGSPVLVEMTAGAAVDAAARLSSS